VPFHFGFCTHNNYLFICGGDQEYLAKQLKATYKIIPNFENSTYSLKQLKDMIYPKRQHALISAGKYIFSLGGYNEIDSTYIKHCERYDSKADEWVEMPNLNKERKGINGVYNGHFVYAIGGKADICMNIVERLSIEHPNRWDIIAIKSLEFSPRCLSAGISLNQSELLIVGGFENNQSLNDTFIMNIETLAINPTTPMNSQDHFFQATAIRYLDQIYIAGTSKPRRIHVYDINERTWKEINIPKIN
jgi:hypothetical protein